MNRDDVRAILSIIHINHNRTVPDGLADIWTATLADIDAESGKAAALHMIKTSPHLPKVSEIREHAKRIEAEADRRQAVLAAGRRPVTPVGEPFVPPVRNGADLVRHVLAAFKAAGQDPANGKFLGKQRAGDIAEQAAKEWLKSNKLIAGAPRPWDAPCEHGQPGGMDLIKASGKPKCPLCRLTRSLIDEVA